MNKRVTSVDVARLAGVSQSAVSRAFSAGSSVSKRTRDKVLAAARELGYKPNALARSLITRRSNMIGVVMGEITNPFYPEVLKALTEKLQAQGLRLMLFSIPEGQDVDDVLPQVLEYRVDGLVITSASLSSAMARECAQLGTPVVLFNRNVRDRAANAVCCDNVEGGRLVANLLLDGGARRPAMITGRPDTSTSADREKGYCGRLEERGVGAPARECGHFTYQGGYAAALRLLAATPRPDAIFCANDIMALGALDASRVELGLRVPEEVSIIGFDDISPAAWPSHNLTTVRQRINKMIDTTVDMLSARIGRPDLPGETSLVPGTLMVRGTCRLPDDPGVYGWPVVDCRRKEET